MVLNFLVLNANVFAQNDLENNLKQETFLEFVEKLAILDVMTDSFTRNSSHQNIYYINYEI